MTSATAKKSSKKSSKKEFKNADDSFAVGTKNTARHSGANVSHDPQHDPYGSAEAAAAKLRCVVGLDHVAVAVVLGSGWSAAAKNLGPFDHTIRHQDLPGFTAPRVESHAGVIHLVRINNKNVALVDGRIHLYEGHGANSVTHAVRTLVACGASNVILTNAAGSLKEQYGPGSILAISDHLNYTGTSPLEGASPDPGYASRFCDLSDLYCASSRSCVADLVDAEGVYAALRGPHYETPAEIRALERAGADLVGMSTVLEAIAAHHMGASVLGLSLVTNYAAGVSTEPLSHVEVIEAGKSAGARLARTLRVAIERI